jgi:hypothetical protein
MMVSDEEKVALARRASRRRSCRVIDAARLDFVLQRFWKGRAGNQRPLDRGDVAAGRCAASSRILRKSGVPLYPTGGYASISSNCFSVVLGPAEITAQPSARAKAVEYHVDGPEAGCKQRAVSR